jgi:acyl-CoA thioesterase-1
MIQADMTRFLTRVVLLVAVASCACAQPEPAAERTPPPSRLVPAGSVASAAPRIVFLGDSLTAGLGLPMEASVPALIERRLQDEGYQYTVVNAGVSGDTSAGGLNRLEWSLEGDVKVLVIELGANDGLRGLPVADLKRNLAEVIVRARGRGIRVVLTGMEAPPNFGAVYTSEFRDVYRQLAREHDVIFVPFFLEGVAGLPALNQSDGIHPNGEGARVIEQRIWRALEPLLTKATHGRGNGTR